MAKTNSFDKAVKGMKMAEAAKKMNVVNFAAEFKKRGINIENSGNGK